MALQECSGGIYCILVLTRREGVVDCLVFISCSVEDCVITAKVTINGEPTSSAGDVEPGGKLDP